ncbi:serine/threonine-protein kinase [Gemmatimonas phototrophica]|uniref:serine/threonine-protein kinase n=1 Tax=Gemmatimonas phototrophica TaxID=1379270 RepID=UPI0006A740F1|nr:serine/threonine-protein kinase [Gemmatimonas phototrophica]
MSATKVCPQCGDEYDDAIAFCSKDGTPLVAQSEGNLIGKMFGGRYKVIQQLGEGGMGQVYLAEHVRMKRKSAIKIMRPALVHEPEALQRFTREAENASKISHPNVASIFDFGETDEGLVYLAMEFIEGESLSALLKREIAMHPVVAADIIAQASDALAAAHELGILHRDIKPDNIMVSKRPDGTFVVKLVDFGIARTMERGSQQVTRTGFAVGTPEYMSPEQLSGDVLDARSDQYSLALVAFIALTGHDAFPNSSSKESLIARLTSRPRRLDEVRDDLDWPNSIQSVFDQSLAPDPSDRFPSVAEFGVALANAVEEMTPTQTAEMYRHALGQRMLSVAARTPGENSSVRTPAKAQATQKAKAQKAEAKRRRDPVAVRRRQSIFPYIVMAAGLTYGVYFYGSKQPAGTTANDAAVQIAAMASSAKAIVSNFTGKKADSTVTAKPEPTTAPVTKRVRKKAAADTTATAAVSADSAAKPIAGDSGAASTTPPPPDSSSLR